MTNHTVTHPRSSPALTFFLLSSTSDYLTCSIYFIVDSLSATLKMSSPSRKVLGPYPTPCPSPAQRTGQDSAARCSAPSRLQHRGQARTQQGGAQPPPVSSRGQVRTRQGGAQPLPVSSTELRPALGRGREVLSPLLSPAQRSGKYSAPFCLQHKGQGGTQSPPVSSTEGRPGLSREVLSPLLSPAQSSGLNSADGEQMHDQHRRDRHAGC